MAVEARDRDKSELVLPPNEFAHVQDASKGEIDTYVGPVKVSLSGDNIPMVFDGETKRFKPVGMESSKQTFITAPAGWYIVLLNPATKHPKEGAKNSTPEDMKIGKKVVIPGPCSFPLWPGQMAEVVQGHRLRSNEYLIIEVYDDEAARESWTSATVKKAGQSTDDDVSKSENGTGGSSAEKKKEKREELLPKEKISGLLSSVPADLANGKRYIIKGTEYAFYIPSSGVKVLEKEEEYIRQAVTLEKLEYTILLDESGDKEYAYGPKVVFPQPTQQFIESPGGAKKYRAIELDALKGVYIKVIESYDDGGQEYKEGEELFITGDGIIYFPRKEHSIISYGGNDVHFATAIPKGEGRYLLIRKSGEVATIHGPKMLLPDPRNEVMTRRILSEREVRLFYPGNQDALAMNLQLAASIKDSSPESVAAFIEKASDTFGASLIGAAIDTSYPKGMKRTLSKVETNFGGDIFDRKAGYTQPRTIVLDTKYMGAVPINVWTGYAVKVTDKTGKGRVAVGPTALLLEYDETLEPMQLSTGTPKNADKLIETAYLKVQGNKVSDKIEAVTADLVGVKVFLSYRVNFDGDDSLKWFAVENYVKFLCDHASSVVKAVVKKQKITDLYANFTEIIRGAILGQKPDNGERSGMIFKENNMKIYDVEVFELHIGDEDVQALLVEAQQNSIETALKISARQQEVDAVKTMEKMIQDELATKRTTEQAMHKIALDRINERGQQAQAEVELNYEMARANLEHDEKIANAKIQGTQTRLEIQRDIDDIRRFSQVADWNASEEHEANIARLLLEIATGRASAAKVVASAFSPHLIEAITTLRDAHLLNDLAKNFGDLSILEGKSVMATATRFLDVIPRGLVPVLDALFPKDSDLSKLVKKDQSTEE